MLIGVLKQVLGDMTRFDRSPSPYQQTPFHFRVTPRCKLAHGGRHSFECEVVLIQRSCLTTVDQMRRMRWDELTKNGAKDAWSNLDDIKDVEENMIPSRCDNTCEVRIGWTLPLCRPKIHNTRA